MTELKTFNDILEEFKSDCTAKDFMESILINKPLVGANAYYLDRLKQEAIRWFKELEIGDNPLLDYSKDNIEADDWIMKWIIHFFNITEEDLK